MNAFFIQLMLGGNMIRQLHIAEIEPQSELKGCATLHIFLMSTHSDVFLKYDSTTTIQDLLYASFSLKLSHLSRALIESKLEAIKTKVLKMPLSRICSKYN
jgi:hypothetical protein